MTIKNLLRKFTEDTNVRIFVHHGGDATETIYTGTHKLVPYIIAEYPVLSLYLVDNRLNIGVPYMFGEGE